MSNKNTELIYGQTEFSRLVPDIQKIGRMAERYAQNRELLARQAAQWGLDPGLFTNRNVLVGPFVSPNPLPTTFGGNIDAWKASERVLDDFETAFAKQGFTANTSSVVLIRYNEVPRQGSSALDSLVLPKGSDNQRITLIDKPPKDSAYNNATTSQGVIDKAITAAQGSFGAYLGQYPELKKGGKGNTEIRDALIQDIRGAFDVNRSELSPGQAGYLDFSNSFNDNIRQRFGETRRPIAQFVDQAVYDPFLKEGVVDPGQFARKVESTGFFDDNPGFVKALGPDGLIQIGRVEQIWKNDILLRLAPSDKTITFNELVGLGLPMATCKELTYLVCMGSIVPAVYGSQNSGEYYSAYASTKARLGQLGLSPIFYRIQPKIPDGYQGVGSVFDFYRQGVTANAE